jgi:hypothetical protein
MFKQTFQDVSILGFVAKLLPVFTNEDVPFWCIFSTPMKIHGQKLNQVISEKF